MAVVRPERRPGAVAQVPHRPVDVVGHEPVPQVLRHEGAGKGEGPLVFLELEQQLGHALGPGEGRLAQGRRVGRLVVLEPALGRQEVQPDPPAQALRGQMQGQAERVAQTHEGPAGQQPFRHRLPAGGVDGGHIVQQLVQRRRPVLHVEPEEPHLPAPPGLRVPGPHPAHQVHHLLRRPGPHPELFHQPPGIAGAGEHMRVQGPARRQVRLQPEGGESLALHQVPQDPVLHAEELRAAVGGLAHAHQRGPGDHGPKGHEVVIDGAGIDARQGPGGLFRPLHLGRRRNGCGRGRSGVPARRAGQEREAGEGQGGHAEDGFA